MDLLSCSDNCSVCIGRTAGLTELKLRAEQHQPSMSTSIPAHPSSTHLLTCTPELWCRDPPGKDFTLWGTFPLGLQKCILNEKQTALEYRVHPWLV